MKKLMIAAAVAAMTAGAFAVDCSPEEQDPEEAAWVYNVKFTGKTTAGEAGVVKGAVGNICAPGGDSTTVCIRKKDSLKIEGWVATCNPTCDYFADLGGFSDKAFWAEKPNKTIVVDDAFAFNVYNIFGKSLKDVEVEGTFEGSLPDLQGQTFAFEVAGFGTYDKKHERVSKVNGNFAGVMSTSFYVKNHVCCPTVVFMCDDLSTAVEDVETVAFGSWSVNFNKKAAKKYLKNGTTPKTPSFWYAHE
ncbi:MAG: hypothetical protein K6G91_03070 [Kiritimatiellae bacterium]|nr:hypothetical protein [Kiritimatiellia bacterium]